VGGHLKNSIALSLGREVFMGQHIGDLETVEACAAFERAAGDLPALYEAAPRAVACDLHPDYYSTRFAESQAVPVIRVQHHEAHVFSCMADQGLAPPVLGVAWDGTGYGAGGVIWGGEFFHVSSQLIRRVAHLRPFPLPGGEAAIREPRRAAVGLLYALDGDAIFAEDDLPLWRHFSPNEHGVLRTMLLRKVNTPLTTSAGRLFDAAAALAGVRSINRFEGEAALAWEWLADGIDDAGSYAMSIEQPLAGFLVLDWEPLVRAMRAELRACVPAAVVSARFHNGLCDGIVRVCRLIGERVVALTGGCFVNRRLLESVVVRLRAEGFCPHWHERVPSGDGGLALGQIMAAARTLSAASS
jgi:hydrogenase maturation protein HypF